MWRKAVPASGKSADAQSRTHPDCSHPASNPACSAIFRALSATLRHQTPKKAALLIGTRFRSGRVSAPASRTALPRASGILRLARTHLCFVYRTSNRCRTGAPDPHPERRGKWLSGRHSAHPGDTTRSAMRLGLRASPTAPAGDSYAVRTDGRSMSLAYSSLPMSARSVLSALTICAHGTTKAIACQVVECYAGRLRVFFALPAYAARGIFSGNWRSLKKALDKPRGMCYNTRLYGV